MISQDSQGGVVCRLLFVGSPGGLSGQGGPVGPGGSGGQGGPAGLVIKFVNAYGLHGPNNQIMEKSGGGSQRFKSYLIIYHTLKSFQLQQSFLKIYGARVFRNTTIRDGGSTVLHTVCLHCLLYLHCSNCFNISMSACTFC